LMREYYGVHLGPGPYNAFNLNVFMEETESVWEKAEVYSKLKPRPGASSVKYKSGASA
jgi:hypothetical protein